MSRESRNKRAWLGIVLLIVGIVYLVDNLNLIPFYIPYYFFSWEMLFIVIGFAMLITGKRAGFVFLIIGGFFILPDILYIPGWYMRNWWPLILIIIGVYLLMRKGQIGRFRRDDEASDNDSMDDVNIFGGGDRVITAQNFRGGKTTTIFGGSDINLQNAKLSTGHNVIDIFTLFGGVDFRIPSDWTIKVDVFSIFGGFSDKRGKVEASDAPEKTLHLKGFIMFGGGEIKSP